MSGIITKLKLLYDLFHKGKEVSNVETWKLGQVSVNALTVFIVALLQVGSAFGFDVSINNEQVVALAGGILAIANTIITVITTKKIGLTDKEIKE